MVSTQTGRDRTERVAINMSETDGKTQVSSACAALTAATCFQVIQMIAIEVLSITWSLGYIISAKNNL